MIGSVDNLFLIGSLPFTVYLSFLFDMLLHRVFSFDMLLTMLLLDCFVQVPTILSVSEILPSKMFVDSQTNSLFHLLYWPLQILSKQMNRQSDYHVVDHHTILNESAIASEKIISWNHHSISFVLMWWCGNANLAVQVSPVLPNCF